MKKISKVLVFVLAFVTFAVLESNAQKSNSIKLTSCVSVEEYGSMSSDEKVLADLYNASIAGLKAMSMNGNTNKYVSVVMFSTDNTKTNHLSIGLDENSQNKGRSCTVCGIRSAYSCIKQVKQYMADNGMSTITITFSSDSEGCAVATW